MLMTWIESLVLGVVQGITEFLPISSDGHLMVTQSIFNQITGQKRSTADEIFFDVMLHVGTLVAIILHYRANVIEGARGLLLGSETADPAYRRPSVIRVGILAVIATLPLIPDKLFLMPVFELAFENLTATGVGFLITAAVLLLTVRLKGGEKGPAETTWASALLVGIAQMFAPLPGVSRSGLTIASALALGFSRTWAVNFSLLIAVPAILGATVFELRKVDPKILTGERVGQIVASAAVAGVIGYFAIVWLVRIVRSGRVWYFSVYLVLLGLGLIGYDVMRKGGSDGRPPSAADGPIHRRPPGPRDRTIAGRLPVALVGRVLDGPDATPPAPRP